jgi:hypothetical protein
MAGTIKRIGPTALTTTLTTNVYNQSSALIYDVINHVEVTNKTGTAATFTLYIGATGANTAGTEWFTAISVPANSQFHWYGAKKIVSTDFIVGGAGTTTALVIQMESQQYVV